MKVTTFLAGFTLALSTITSAADNNWLTNFEEAKKKATEEKKDLLVDFTGSDWCHACTLLSKEVFEKEAFQQEVSDKFVLLELDYPRDRSKQSEELQKQNEELQRRFNVEGFPTILLLDSRGRPYARTGYAEGGPEAYLKSLDKMQQLRVRRDGQLAEAEKLEGLAKAKALITAMSEIPPTLQSDFYGDIVKAIIKLDPKNETGYTTIMAALDLEKKYIAAMESRQIDLAMKLVTDFITMQKPTGIALQQALSMKVDPLLGAARFEEAEKIIEEIVAAGPDTEEGARASAFKPRLAYMKAEAAKKSEAPTEPSTPQKVVEKGEEKK